MPSELRKIIPFEVKEFRGKLALATAGASGKEAGEEKSRVASAGKD